MEPPALEGEIALPFFFFFFNFIYYFILVVLGLCCCVQAFSSFGERGQLSTAGFSWQWPLSLQSPGSSA